MKKFVLFLFSALVLSSCSKLTDEELWLKVEAAKSHSNWDSTQQVCQRIMNEYPESRYAAWARFGLAESYRFKNQHREALDNYKLFYEQYPEMQPSALSLFLVGYIYNNNLQRYDSARVFYEQFLQKFPNHDLIPTVKFELETLGKNPDEALMQSQKKKSTVKK